MWGFTEKDVERFLAEPRAGRQTATIRIDKDQYVVLRSQVELTAVEGVRQNPQKPLFRELGHLAEFLPQIDGQPQFPDIITYKYPKSHKQLVVFELKNAHAKDEHVAQLRRYVNLLQYYVNHNVEDVRRALGIGPGKFMVSGVLLARSVSKKVWLGACLPYNDKQPQVELIAFEVESDPKRRRIRHVRFLDFTKHYAQAFHKVAKKHRSYRRPARQEGLLVDIQETAQPAVLQVAEGLGISDLPLADG